MRSIGRHGWVGLGLICLLASIAPNEPSPRIARPSRLSDLAASQPDWLEYRATPSATGLQASNPAHGLDAIFDPTGTRIHDRRVRSEPNAIASLRLVGFGRGDLFTDVSAGKVSSVGSRVEIRRTGIVEWYENGPEGLEQGFTIESRPTGDLPLALELDVLPATARLAGASVLLSTPTGRELAYQKLTVADASGLRIPARFEVADPARVRLVVDDLHADYPIEIDPILSGSNDTTLVSDQASSLFGYTVASAGDVDGDGYDDVIVGSNYSDGEANEGAAFLFLGSPVGIPSGSSTSAHTVLQGDQVNAGFGYSVASAGDVDDDGYSDVIVGAPQYDGDINGDLIPDSGAAFVFLGSATGIASVEADDAATRLVATTSQVLFGFSVASAGDVNGDGDSDVIVGARQFSSGQTHEGAAFIYHGSANGVPGGNTGTAATILQSDDPDGELFDVASAGDLNDDGFDDVVVGIPLRASTDEGAAFVYMGSESGVASGGAAAAIILISDQYFANFATRAASAGDVNGDGYGDLVIGAARYDAGETDEGAVFLYLGGEDGISNGTAANAFRRLEANDPGALLGTTVASAGDVNGDGLSDLIGGAPYYGANDAGAAFIWTGEETGGDRDGDGLTNADERLVYHTDVGNPDTDGDSLSDGDEVTLGADPLDSLSPPEVETPFTASNLAFASIADRKSFRVDLATLPLRPRMSAEAVADVEHSDMELAVQISHCTLDPHPTTSPPLDAVYCPRITNPITATGEGPTTAEFSPWECQVDTARPAYAGKSCVVSIRAVDFGSAPSPATLGITIRGITDIPTSTFAFLNVAPQSPIEPTLESGTQPYFNETQNFRWIYDLDRDDQLITPIEGTCTYRRNEPPSTTNLPPITYGFYGDPGYQGPDCCTWQITSTMGVTGVGQAIFFVNSSSVALDDSDFDGIKNLCDNCDAAPNGPLLGTCVYGARKDLPCRSHQECVNGLCSLAQEDGNLDGAGEVCGVPEPEVLPALYVGLLAIGVIARGRRRHGVNGDFPAAVS